jgi:hypothetical protein
MDIDCWEHVLNQLPISCLQSVALTCKLFARIVSSRPFFLALFHRTGLRLFLENNHCVLEPMVDVPDHEEVDCSNEIEYYKYLHKMRLNGRDITNLTGLYRGMYGGHGVEYIWLEQQGFIVTGNLLTSLSNQTVSQKEKATKLTGDENVPRKKMTFQVNLDVFLQHGMGRIQLAGAVFANPYFGRCALKFIPSREDGCFRFECVWFYCADNVNWELVTAESLPTFGRMAIRTRFERANDVDRSDLEDIIKQIPEDELGNVDRAEVERRLEQLREMKKERKF